MAQIKGVVSEKALELELTAGRLGLIEAGNDVFQDTDGKSPFYMLEIKAVSEFFTAVLSVMIENMIDQRLSVSHTFKLLLPMGSKVDKHHFTPSIYRTILYGIFLDLVKDG